MRYLGLKLAIGVGWMSSMFLTTANANLITYTLAADASVFFGPDPLGIDASQILIEIVYDSSATRVGTLGPHDRFGYISADLTISGSTSGDGTYPLDGVRIDELTTFRLNDLTFGGGDLRLSQRAIDVTGPLGATNVLDPIPVPVATQLPFQFTHRDPDTFGFTDYDLFVTQSSSVAEIPEPSALLIGGAAAVCITRRRRRV